MLRLQLTKKFIELNRRNLSFTSNLKPENERLDSLKKELALSEDQMILKIK